MKMVKVTGQDGDVVYIHPKYFIAVGMGIDGQTYVSVPVHDSYTVKETVDEILAQIPLEVTGV